MTTPGRAAPGRSRGETLPDLLGPHTRLLFVGVNPWVVPNPSGLNAHSSLADLAAAYREVAIAAGLDLGPAGG